MVLEEKDEEQVLIEGALDNLKWNEDAKQNESQEDYILSRTDTVKAHAVQAVNLVGYKHDLSTVSQEAFD